MVVCCFTHSGPSDTVNVCEVLQTHRTILDLGGTTGGGRGRRSLVAWSRDQEALAKVCEGLAKCARLAYFWKYSHISRPDMYIRLTCPSEKTLLIFVAISPVISYTSRFHLLRVLQLEATTI
jgi:hypothetical protein